MDLDRIVSHLGDYARDAIVVSEAEPVNRPGPRIVWVNRAFTEMTGYTPEEVIGQTPRMLQGTDTDPQVRSRIRAALDAWRPVREVVKNYHKDGTAFWVELDIQPVADEDGWYHYWVAVQRDVTQRVQAELAMVEARDAAERANRLKTEFLANMSHEIRTPLNGVLGMAQLLRLGALDDRQTRAVETIISSGQALLALIEDILDISKIEAGEMELEPASVTAAELLCDTRDAVAGAAIVKDLTIKIDAGPGAADRFVCDPRRMRQVLVNLAGNAVKFTNAGSVRLIARRIEDRMRFEVADTGPGVPDTLKASVFDRFQQGDQALDRQHEGAGLGLAISKELVTLAGGSIGVEDNPDGGALFWVETPYVAAGPAETKPEAAEVAPSRGRALVVEDNLVNQLVIEETLRDMGLEPTCVTNGHAALEAAQAATFDVAVIDQHMPGLSGCETIRALRATSTQAQALPILMLTADARAETRALALDAGANGCAAKPFDLASLQAEISQLMAQAETSTPPAGLSGSAPPSEGPEDTTTIAARNVRSPMT